MKQVYTCATLTLNKVLRALFKISLCRDKIYNYQVLIKLYQNNLKCDMDIKISSNKSSSCIVKPMFSTVKAFQETDSLQFKHQHQSQMKPLHLCFIL